MAELEQEAAVDSAAADVDTVAADWRTPAAPSTGGLGGGYAGSAAG